MQQRRQVVKIGGNFRVMMTVGLLTYRERFSIQGFRFFVLVLSGNKQHDRVVDLWLTCDP